MWQGRWWSSAEWSQYQRDLERSDLDTQTEQAKQDLLAISKDKPIKVTINGQELQEYVPKIHK